MAEDAHPKATSGPEPTRSGDMQNMNLDHEGRGSSSNDTSIPQAVKVESDNHPNGNSRPAADAATTTSDARVCSIPKFNPDTEKEIRTLMNNVRLIQEGNTLNEEGIMDLAALTTNLIQLLNAEYIAKETIVRAVAYMRGESHLAARRALGQAKRDRRAARHNHNRGNSGQRSRGKTEQDNKGATHAAGASPNGDGKDGDSKSATSVPAATGPKAAALQSDANYEANSKAVANGTGSGKDGILPVGDDQSKDSGVSATKAKKKKYWKSRRQQGKRVTDDSLPIIGAVEDGAKITIKDDKVVAVNTGAGIPVEAETESDDNTIGNTAGKAKTSNSKGATSDKETGKDVANRA